MNDVGDPDETRVTKGDGGKAASAQRHSSEAGKPERPTPDLAEAGIPQDVIEKLPPEQRERVMESFASLMMFQGPMTNPIFQKLTPEHVSELIKHVGMQMTDRAADRRSARKYNFFGYFLVGLFALLGLVVFAVYTGNKDLLIGMGISITSFAGGYGLGQAKAKSS